MKHKDVGIAWVSGRAFTSGNFRTDGTSAWSYAEKIGDTVNGQKIVLSPGRSSVTTSRHVSALIKAGGVKKDT